MAGEKKQETDAFMLLSALIMCSYQMMCAAQQAQQVTIYFNQATAVERRWESYSFHKYICHNSSTTLWDAVYFSLTAFPATFDLELPTNARLTSRCNYFQVRIRDDNVWEDTTTFLISLRTTSSTVGVDENRDQFTLHVIDNDYDRTADSCPPATVISGSEVSCSNSYAHGSDCSYECSDGYERWSGNYLRTCYTNSEWSGLPLFCVQIVDECSLGTHNCFSAASCANAMGSFTCTCPAGYTGDGVTCTDIDECQDGHNCEYTSSVCENTDGTYHCECRDGYTGNIYGGGQTSTCTDIDECSSNNGNCPSAASCTNYGGSFTCTCPTGYNYEAATCVDINECSNDHPCARQATCQNTDGSYTCTCNSGYSGNGHQCRDINECNSDRHNCSSHASCNNYGGGFSCSCNTGYSGNGVTCEDIDECSNRHRCASQATCQNTDGSYTCTCNSGYSGNGHWCTDIDECSLNRDNCSPDASCSNYYGGFSCTCNSGYFGNGVTCVETNECSSEPCLNEGECINRVNGFSCTCKAGFAGTYCETELPVLNDAPISEDASNTSITISWRAWDPDMDDGDHPILAYIPYYRMDASDEWISGPRILTNETLQFKADNLEVDTLYEFSVAVVREVENAEGPRSPSLKVKTLCNVPDLAVSVNVQLTSSNKVNVSWQLPAGEIMCSTGVTSYKVYYKIEGSIADTPQLAGTVEDVDTRWLIVDEDLLEPGSSYIFFVTAHTDQESGFSESEPINAPVNRSHVGTIVAVMCSVVFLIVLLLVVLVIIKRKRDKKADAGAPAAKPVDNTYDNPVFDNPVERRQGAEAANAKKPVYQMQLAEKGDHEKISLESFSVDEESSPDEAIYGNLEPPQPIRVSEFKDYFKQNIDKFEQEFSILRGSKKQFDWTAAENPANKKKNRFKNIYTYDHSRVVLKTVSDQEGSDYYNASFIKNANGVIAYIASQAPNKASLEDFIRMIWEQNVATIVMVANLFEEGKERCQQYWPETEGSHKSFGSVTVTWLKTTKYSDFVIRSFLFKKGKKTREVQQLHFLTWPDKDTPEHGTALIEFAKQSKLLNHGKKYPMLVHCSAGIGRTGTFICLSCMMDALRDKEYIDVFGFVNKMRENRVNMVQTSKQYVFLYKCLNEYHLTHQTEMSVRQMTGLDVDSHRGALLGEFKLLSELVQNPQKDTDENCAGKRRENIARNRVRNMVPSNKNRVFLMSPGQSNEGNYINASYVKSFQKKDAFITTQSPLPYTTEDFWRMVYDVKSPIVVMLNQLDPTDRTCLQYWPDHGSREYGNMHITCMATDEGPSSYIQRTFDVKHVNSKEVLSVTHIQMKKWNPDTNLEGIVSVFKDVDMMHKRGQYTQPIVVHCINGFDRSGVVVTVISELERITVTERIDVFSTVKKLRDQHEHMLKNTDDYILCYHLLKAYLTSSNSDYENVDDIRHK